MTTAVRGVPQSYIFRDGRGFTATMKVFLTNGTPTAMNTAGANIAAALCAVSGTAQVQDGDGTFGSPNIKSKGPYTTIDSPYAAGAPVTYLTVADKVAMLFNDADGNPHVFLVSIPLATTASGASFAAADNKTLLKTNTEWAALAAAITAGCSTAQGTAISSWVQGYRVTRKIPRRLNRTLKDTSGNFMWPQ